MYDIECYESNKQHDFQKVLSYNDKSITINGGILPAGKYAVFSIADDSEWTIIFNKTADQWGAYDYKEKEDDKYEYDYRNNNNISRSRYCMLFMEGIKVCHL